MATLNITQFAGSNAPSSYIPNTVILPAQNASDLVPTSSYQNHTLDATTTLIRVNADVAVKLGTLRVPAESVEYFQVTPGSTLTYKLA